MKLTAFILPRCPYCLQARELIGELRAERPELSSVEIEFVDEAQQPLLAERYDYYRVPSFFLGEEKLYEASPLWSRAEAKRRLSAMFDRVTEGRPGR
jgi:glutaredoxin